MPAIAFTLEAYLLSAIYLDIVYVNRCDIWIG